MKRARVKAMSDKRMLERQERRAVVELVISRAYGKCKAADLVPEIECYGPMDVDEIIPRSQYPGGHLDIDNCQLLCRSHHDWKHAYPEAAAALGLRKWSWERNK